MIIRKATMEEFEIAVEWAAQEGWNPGLDDLDVFYNTDPNGFLMGFEGDEPISSISVVRYGKTYGFLGFYIVRQDKRGQGAGIKIWNAGMDYLKGRTIGLDGVLAQQSNYETSGFVRAGRTIRFSGKLDKVQQQDLPGLSSVGEDDLSAIMAWDRSFFPAERDVFLARWLMPLDPLRRSLVLYDKEEVAAYGTIRRCCFGYKIGPLFADNKVIAEMLLGSLAQFADGETIILDVPADNFKAVQLAGDLSLAPAFETVRMYHGAVPNLDMTRTYGITTFELG